MGDFSNKAIWLGIFCIESESHSVVSNSLWLPWTTVHGILQARILAWVAFPFSREPSQPKAQTQVSGIAGKFFTSWAKITVSSSLLVFGWFKFSIPDSVLVGHVFVGTYSFLPVYLIHWHIIVHMLLWS